MKNILRSFLPSCANCLEPSAHLFCESCLKKLKFSNACPLCGSIPLAAGLQSCVTCAKKTTAWQNISIAFFYEDGIRDWIGQFKDGSKPERIRELRQEMLPVLPKVDFIVPVTGDPLSCRRRLYDPTFELAQHLGSMIQTPVAANIFRRRPFLSTQKELDLATRLRYLDRLITMTDLSIFLTGASVLLVDDVMTTGASVSVHAKLLREVAAEVHVFCLSRALKTS